MQIIGSAGGAYSRAGQLAAPHFAAGAAGVGLVSVYLVNVTVIGPGFAAFSLGIFTALAAMMIAVAPGLTMADGVFGAANKVTMIRAVLVCLIGGLLAPAAPGGYLAAWAAVVAAATVLLLDGVDGWLARRTRRVSAFGARFDMETDALLALVLSVLVFQLDKAGAWIIAAGAARYGFLLAGLVLPRLRRPLPPRRGRQAVCVMLIGALTLCVAPAIAPIWSEALAAMVLAAVVWSFGIDVAWLLRQPRYGESK